MAVRLQARSGLAELPHFRATSRPRWHGAALQTAAALATLSLLAHAPQASAQPSGPATSYAFEARRLFDLAACARPPTGLDPARDAVVLGHCRALKPILAEFHSRWLVPARAFFGPLVPRHLPDTVLYPFGGSDLVTLLTVFPDARLLTSISLEASGDPRGLEALQAAPLAQLLQQHRTLLARQLALGHSRTDNLLLLTRGALSSELFFNLVALTVHSCRPVDLRYFRVGPAGALDYVGLAEVAKVESALTRQPGRKRVALRELFSNMELSFRCGDRPDAPLRRYRHIRADLSDAGLAANPGLLALLRQPFAAVAMLKAASYLVQMRIFTTIRNLLLDRTDWMISDATGVLPAQAQSAGFEQRTWGQYAGSFLPHARPTDAIFVALWRGQPQRPLPMRFGYPDVAGASHLMVTRRTPPPRPRLPCWEPARF